MAKQGAPRARKVWPAKRAMGAKVGSTGVHAESRSWKLQDAKARFSEVVRRAHDEGPQYVTVRGKPAVAVIDAAELERLLPSDRPMLPFVEFMESLYVEGLSLEREIDRGRDVDL